MALHQQEWLRDVRRVAAFEWRRAIVIAAEFTAEQYRARQGSDHQIRKIAMREDLDHGADIVDFAPAIALFRQPFADWRRRQAEHVLLAEFAQFADRADERLARA